MGLFWIGRRVVVNGRCVAFFFLFLRFFRGLIARRTGSGLLATFERAATPTAAVEAGGAGVA